MSEKRSAEKIVKEFKRKTRRKPQGRLGRGRDWWTSSFTFEMSEKGRQVQSRYLSYSRTFVLYG
jgi:hypothetical protein